MNTFPITSPRYHLLLALGVLALVAYAVIATAQIRELRTRVRLADGLFILTHTSQPLAVPKTNQQAEIIGIGIALARDAAGAPQIARVFPNSPAAKASVSVGDAIRKIDDTETSGKTLDECVSMIRGPEGTSVRIEIVRSPAQTTLQLQLTRQKLAVSGGSVP